MRGEYSSLPLAEDPTSDELRFRGFKLYTDPLAFGGGDSGVVIPCLCFPFPLTYRYFRQRGGDRFDPACSPLPCKGPWIGSFHGCCCTESGTFTDENTFESICSCCGKMERRR